MRFNQGQAVLHGGHAWQVLDRNEDEGTYELLSLDGTTEITVDADEVVSAP